MADIIERGYGPRAEALIQRLVAVDLERPVIDRAKAEAAINQHLAALDIPLRPIRWFEDARAARAALDAPYFFYYYGWRSFLSAREAVYWTAAAEASLNSIPEVEKLLGVWLPFVEAHEAGLWVYWILETEVWAITRPAMRVKGDQLHCEDGPAVHWPGGEAYYFLNGVEMDKQYVMTPADKLPADFLLREPNAEKRRELVRKIGIERICADLHARVIDRETIVLPARTGLAWDEETGGFVERFFEEQRLDYELLMLDLKDGRRRPYLKMFNPSVEGLIHIEGVGPECRTVRAALHWRKPDPMRAIPISDTGADWQQQGDVYIWPLGAESLKPLPLQLT